MALPAFYYNGKTINWPENIYQFQPNPPHAVLRNRSASGLEEILNVNFSEIIQIAGRLFENADPVAATFKRNCRQLYQWAQKGGAFKFAMDSAETVLTTLASGCSAGDSSIVLTSAAGVVAGKTYILRNKTDMDIVKILSIAGAPTVTLVESLNFGFSSLDRFRSELYWPARLVDNTNPIVEVPPLHFDSIWRFIEDINS